MGELAGGPLFAFQQKHRAAEPKLSSWDAWGHRVDTIELTPLWQEAARIAAERGVVATAYERKHGEYSRIHQFALAYLFDGTTEVYACPLAMTDGAARTLLAHGNQTLIDRAVPRMTSRDPARAWTSGQWMTERTGGSDVAISETVTRKVGEEWRLYGTKWFTSAVTSPMALTLARPEGAPPGGEGLALFYLETRDERGPSPHIVVNRLKEKLGTRMVPTAELTLDGAAAIPVAGLSRRQCDPTKTSAITRPPNPTASEKATTKAAQRRCFSLSHQAPGATGGLDGAARAGSPGAAGSGGGGGGGGAAFAKAADASGAAAGAAGAGAWAGCTDHRVGSDSLRSISWIMCSSSPTTPWAARTSARTSSTPGGGPAGAGGGAEEIARAGRGGATRCSWLARAGRGGGLDVRAGTSAFTIVSASSRRRSKSTSTSSARSSGSSMSNDGSRGSPDGWRGGVVAVSFAARADGRGGALDPFGGIVWSGPGGIVGSGPGGIVGSGPGGIVGSGFDGIVCSAARLVDATVRAGPAGTSIDWLMEGDLLQPQRRCTIGSVPTHDPRAVVSRGNHSAGARFGEELRTG
jgi:Adaptive response protein AidB N-terminal domain/Acyl-CoA dehydrogenase, middle domain